MLFIKMHEGIELAVVSELLWSASTSAMHAGSVLMVTMYSLESSILRMQDPLIQHAKGKLIIKPS